MFPFPCNHYYRLLFIIYVCWLHDSGIQVKSIICYLLHCPQFGLPPYFSSIFLLHISLSPSLPPSSSPPLSLSLSFPSDTKWLRKTHQIVRLWSVNRVVLGPKISPANWNDPAGTIPLVLSPALIRRSLSVDCVQFWNVLNGVLGRFAAN